MKLSQTEKREREELASRAISLMNLMDSNMSINAWGQFLFGRKTLIIKNIYKCPQTVTRRDYKFVLSELDRHIPLFIDRLEKRVSMLKLQLMSKYNELG